MAATEQALQPDAVTITENRDGSITIATGKHPRPEKQMVLSQLKPKQLKLIPPRNRRYRYYTLENCISDTKLTIGLQAWSDAVAAAIALMERNLNPAASTLITPPLQQDNYLSIGDTLYQLVPQANLGLTKALAHVKKVATDRAKLQARKVLDDAEAAARHIRASAEQAQHTILANANEIKREADRALAQARAANYPPAWMIAARLPVLPVNNTSWAFAKLVEIKLEFFTFEYSVEQRVGIGSIDDGTMVYKRLEIAVENSHSLPAVPVLMWFPVETATGRTVATAVRVAAGSTYLPHMNDAGSCQGPADYPAFIHNLTEANTAVSAIQRTMRGVVLDSLYSVPSRWLPAFKAYVPSVLYPLLCMDNYKQQLRAFAEAHSDHVTTIDHNQEASEVFSV